MARIWVPVNSDPPLSFAWIFVVKVMFSLWKGLAGANLLMVLPEETGQ